MLKTVLELLIMDPFSKSKIFGADSTNEPAKPAEVDETIEPKTDNIKDKAKKPKNDNKVKKPFSKTLALAIALVVVSLLCVMQTIRLSSAQKDTTSSSKSMDETSNIETDKYQAVFLNNGQTYFGKIETLNSNFLTLSDVYYLRQTQSNNYDQTKNVSTDFSLVKLGCEVHSPRDKMVISRQEVSFWENINDTGRVVKAINTYHGQTAEQKKCPA